MINALALRRITALKTSQARACKLLTALELGEIQRRIAPLGQQYAQMFLLRCGHFMLQQGGRVCRVVNGWLCFHRFKRPAALQLDRGPDVRGRGVAGTSLTDRHIEGSARQTARAAEAGQKRPSNLNRVFPWHADAQPDGDAFGLAERLRSKRWQSFTRMFGFVQVRDPINRLLYPAHGSIHSLPRQRSMTSLNSLWRPEILLIQSVADEC